MHLADILSIRAIPAAGVSIGITRRCPLHCAHCSTDSRMDSEQLAAKWLTAFVDSFTPEQRPRLMAMSGGEAMLRPGLVVSLAERARRVGVQSSVLSGGFFAKQGKIPPAIFKAFMAVDHCSFSMDRYHEAEVPREQVFSVLARLLDLGKDLSMHLVGEHADDPYLDDVTTAVRKRFGDRVPMMVNTLSAFGRGQHIIQWRPSRLSRTGQDGYRQTAPSWPASPCTMAAWPVVGFDGIVAACGNDHLIGRVPAHLRLGDIRNDGWAVIAERCRQRASLRALRILGPQRLIQQSLSQQQESCSSSQPNQPQIAASYCDSCVGLSNQPEVIAQAELWTQRPATAALEACVLQAQIDAGPVGFAERYSHPRYAELTLLGAES